MKTRSVKLTDDELALLIDALDSHRYWQLSDEQYRSDGFVFEPGSDDEDNADGIKACVALESKLHAARYAKGTK